MRYDIPSTKKLWNGRASIRDYLVKKCIKAQENLVVTYLGKVMTLTPAQLARSTQWNKRVFQSKFGKGSYTLLDFTFIADDSSVPLAVEEQDKDQLRLFDQ